MLPAADGCDALDLLDFAVLGFAPDVFAAEFTVLAEEEARCVLVFDAAGCMFELPLVAAAAFIGAVAEFDEATGCALLAVSLAVDVAAAELEFVAGRISSDVDNTISTGASAGG